MFIDIAVNLSDPQFQGIYHGKQGHESDFNAVLERAKEQKLTKILVTGTDLGETKESVKICEDFHCDYLELYCTGGIHPCSALAEYNAQTGGKQKSEEAEGDYDIKAIDARIQDLLEVARSNPKTVLCLGEFGLDYDRFHFSPEKIQKLFFEQQLKLFAESGLNLPLFLHSRAAHKDFCDMLYPYLKDGKFPRGGVVHSFTGTLEELQDHVKMGLYIGINGCSLKTKENLDVAKEIPLELLLLETDAPWCEIRPSHESHKLLQGQKLPYEAKKKERFVENSMIKGRCEPANIVLVAKVMAELKGIPLEELTDVVYQNSLKFLNLEK
ncbi:Deoxyribonuclease Tat-D [Yarrowia sp. C11]|nr:Deoxyribonuclease Tat-D [Yarrowia sp. C11]KAG5370426.1 Deoxyribonuclease Tat-D [Yarrowia sp. E02]